MYTISFWHCQAFFLEACNCLVFFERSFYYSRARLLYEFLVLVCGDAFCQLFLVVFVFSFVFSVICDSFACFECIFTADNFCYHIVFVDLFVSTCR